MSERAWNPQQKSAIESFGGNILVSAAAGSGKTAVLVERVVRMLTDPINPIDADRLLIVTFTKLAAAEMKTRISAALEKLCRENPNDRGLARQLILMERAHIGTIHSFCSDVVKENSAVLGLPPGIEVIDEEDGKDLSALALEDVIEEYYKSKNQDFIDLCETLGGGRNDSGLSETVTSLYNFISSMPHYEEWLNEKLELYSQTLPFGETLWGKRIFEDVRIILSYQIDCAKRLKNACDEEYIEKLSALVSEDIASLEGLLSVLETGRWNSFVAAINGISFGRKPSKCNTSPILEQQYKRVRDAYKAAVKDLMTDYSITEEDFFEDIAKLYPTVKCLFGLTLDFARHFSDLKREKSVADFSDLEQLSLAVLTEKDEHGKYIPTKIARDMSSRFDYILVDECQDTNKVQETILKTVSNGKNMFFVGDVKQSIYRFRNAMPELFLEKRENWPLLTENSKFPATIILGRNYRSRKNIAGAVNYIFSQLMSKESAEIEYNSEEMLIPAAEYPEDGNTVRNELMLIDSQGERVKTESVAVAEKIEKMLLEKVQIYDKELKKCRDITPGDICILLRAHKGKTEFFLSALRARGISCKSENDVSFLSRPEISAVIDVLKAVDNPLLDIPLAGTMLSEMFLFTPDELAELRGENKKEPLWLSLKRNAENNPKTENFIKTLDSLRKAAAYERSDSLIERLYDMTSFPQIMLSCPDGDLRLGNLRLLVKYACDRENRGASGLSSFLRFVSRLEARNADLHAAGNTGSSDSVRVMSVHSSKGLEFPVVFLCCTSKKFKIEKSNEIMLHPVLGFGCPRRDKATGARFKTIPQLAVKSELRRYNLAEEMRILYVALTRPKENLIITYCEKNVLDMVGKICANIDFEGKFPPFLVQNAKNDGEWLVSALLRHPDAINIRAKAEIGEEIVLSDSTPWAFSYVEEIFEKAEKEPTQKEEKADFDRKIYETLKSRTGWRYPYMGSVNIPAKAGVSSLTHQELHEKMLFSARPKGSALSGAERGTALHTFMQFCDFSLAKKDSKAEIARLLEKSFITEKQAKAISPEKVSAFFESDLFKRIEKSPRVWRELRFLQELPALELGYENASPTDKITVQGVADCVFEEDGNLVVVDYKTDLVENPEELKLRYSAQLNMYKRLLSDSLGKKVSKSIIWSFCFGKELEV